MNENVSLLPVGSIVYLKDGNVKIMVVTNGQLVQEGKDKLPVFWDYMGGVYPQVYEKDNMFYFNQEDIAKVVFRGYEDDTNDRYMELIKEWKEKNVGKYTVKHDLKSLDIKTGEE